MRHPSVLRVWIINLLSCLMLCCGLGAGEAKPAYDIIDWKASPKGETGETKGELKHPVKGHSIMRYRMFAPGTLPERPVLGLVIAFHGLNSDENGVTGHAHQSLVEIGAADGYVVAGGKSVGNGWGAGDDAALQQFIDWIETVYPIDRRRVFVWGHSNGGFMSSWFASHHPDRIAGLVRWCGYGQDQPAKPGSGLEYYLVHGDADPTVKVDQSRNLRDALRRGGHFVYRELHGGDHGSILGVLPVRQDAARWLDALRHPDIAPSADELKFLRQTAAAKGDEALADAATWQELVRIGGAPAWAVAAKAAKSKQAAVRAALAQACARCRFADDETVGALAKLAEDDDASVRTPAIAALAVHANWRSTAAQAALGRLALVKKRPSEDRTAAATGLANALVLPLLGNTADDPMLAEAAVALLDADLAEVRSAVFAPLKTAMANGLGYDPDGDPKARKAGAAAWKTWFDERSGKPAAKR